MTKDNLLELLLMMIMMMMRMRMMTMMMMNGFCGVVWLTEGSRFALFQAETIVRNPHHRKSPARLEKGILKTTTHKWKFLYLQMLAWLQLYRFAIYFLY